MFGHPSMLSGPADDVRGQRLPRIPSLPADGGPAAAAARPAGRLPRSGAQPARAAAARCRWCGRSRPTRPSSPRRELIRRKPVVCEPDDSVRDVTRRMAAAESSAALVRLDENGEFGIVTDSDLRARVLAAGHSTDGPVREVMIGTPPSRSGPISTGQRCDARDARPRRRHVPVISPFGEPLGVLVAVELLATQTHTPFALRREIDAAAGVDDLRKPPRRMRSAVIDLQDAGEPPGQISRVIAVVADAVTHRLIELALEELGEPPAPFSWLAFGSLGRREISPGSDIDSALTWSGPYEPEDPALHDRSRRGRGRGAGRVRLRGRHPRRYRGPTVLRALERGLAAGAARGDRAAGRRQGPDLHLVGA